MEKNNNQIRSEFIKNTFYEILNEEQKEKMEQTDVYLMEKISYKLKDLVIKEHFIFMKDFIYLMNSRSDRHDNIKNDTEYISSFGLSNILYEKYKIHLTDSDLYYNEYSIVVTEEMKRIIHF